MSCVLPYAYINAKYKQVCGGSHAASTKATIQGLTRTESAQTGRQLESECSGLRKQVIHPCMHMPWMDACT